MGHAQLLDLDGLQGLIDALAARGYRVIGPTVRGSAIVHAPITSIDELPRGWGDEQESAHYRLRRRDDDALFGFAASPQAAKQVLFPADELLWRGRRAAGQFAVEDRGVVGGALAKTCTEDAAPDSDRVGGDARVPDGGTGTLHATDPAAPPETAPPADAPPYAFLGIRSCDLRAVEIHDTVLLGRAFVDVRYAARREGAFVVAVTCTDPGGTCFCVSMGGGPHPESGYDLALTELLDDGPHRFVVEVGTQRGAEVLAGLAAGPALASDVMAAHGVAASAAERMGRTLDTDGLKEALYAAVESPRWDDIAARCLACTNCTLVCPTCFCTSVEDVADLTGDLAERHRVWDSCFTQDFAYVHGGSVRPDTRSRYRQWMTHKLASWQDQFGSSGCVGCGRCITWCPAAIDITAEATALRTPQPVPVAVHVRTRAGGDPDAETCSV
jgi:ferredoxin